jgi:hypothetical protein
MKGNDPSHFPAPRRRRKDILDMWQVGEIFSVEDDGGVILRGVGVGGKVVCEQRVAGEGVGGGESISNSRRKARMDSEVVGEAPMKMFPPSLKNSTRIWGSRLGPIARLVSKCQEKWGAFEFLWE